LTVERASFREHLELGVQVLSLDSTTTGARLGAKLLANSQGVFDPYVEFAAGGGRYVEHGALQGDRTVSVASAQGVPLLSFAAGARWHVDTAFLLGARFVWTHWLLAPHERCGNAAFGACTFASPAHFDPGNAVWHWQLVGSFLFGSRH
jgi:hypothetical protein